MGEKDPCSRGREYKRILDSIDIGKESPHSPPEMESYLQPKLKVKMKLSQPGRQRDLGFILGTGSAAQCCQHREGGSRRGRGSPIK